MSASFPRIAAALENLRSRPPASIALFVVAGGAAFVFLRIVRELLEGETFAFDRSILLSLRRAGDLSVPVGPAWLVHVMGDLTSLGGITVLGLISLIVVIYLFMIGRRSAGILVLMSVVGGWLLSNGLKIGIARPRPDIVPHLVEVHDLSFPSGHAMLSAVTYLTLGALLGELQKRTAPKIYVVSVAILLTLIVGVSRIYLGVHYPSDVLGGWCAGAVWAMLCWKVSRRWMSGKGRTVAEVAPRQPD